MDPVTTANAALAAAMIPGAAGFVLSRAASLGADAARSVTAASAAAAFVLAALVGVSYAALGPAESTWASLPLPGGVAISVGARVDGLSVLMLLTVTLIGAAVARYTVRYLDGDPDQARFCRSLSYTLSAVLVLIVSSNLAMFAAGWIGASHGLHRLLTHRRERPAAMLAARKKFLVSRIGDVMLLAAFALIAHGFGSLEFSEIFAQLDSATEAGVLPVAVLLVLGAMTKSAQFPFHTWLPDSMETPTPVSALMHAGIINAGGFLLIRMSPLFEVAPAALPPLALGGAFTALLGSVSMLAQTDVKRKLAWSTVAQMGFMMLQCGLGAFAAAALHMVGHAFYKGHAFLSAGTAVDPDPPSAKVAAPVRPAGPLALMLAVAAGLGLVGLVGLAMGVDAASKPGLPVLGSVLALAAAQLLLGSRSVDGSRTRSLTAAAAIGAAVAFVYFTGVGLLERLLGSAIPAAAPYALQPGDPLVLALFAVFGLAFAVQQRLAGDPTSRLAQAAYVHASHGFYLGSIQNRLVERIWPLPKAGRPHAGGARG